MKLVFLFFAFALWCPCEGANRTSESFNGEWKEEHKALVGTGAAAAGVAVLAIIALLAMRKAGLSWVICIWLWSAVLVVGIVAWVITYERMRKVIEDQVENLIYSIGSDVSTRVRREMEAAAEMALQQKLMVANGFVNYLSNNIEHHLLFLQTIWIQFEEFHRSVSLLYYANSQNDIYSIDPAYGIWLGAPANAVFPTGWTCVGDSPFTNCSTHTCGLVGNELFDAQNCSKKCDLPSYSRCNPTDLDINPRFGFATSVKTPTLGTVGTPQKVELKPNTFNSHGRPWYVYTENVIWSAPYVFASDIPVIGLSATSGVKSWNNGPFEGVAAVDFDTSSLRGFVAALNPTNGSNILLILDDGVVITGSHHFEALNNRTGENNEKLNLLNAWDASDPSVSKTMNALEKRMGRNIPRDTATLVHETDIAVLTQPLTVTGDLRLVVIVTIPYKDVLQKAWDASTMSLVLVIVLSIGLSIILVIVFSVLLRPIHELDMAMGLVAWMMVDNLPIVSSRVSEIDSMSRSFNTMVSNLIEYKQYLPQSLLAAQQQEEDSDDSKSESAASNTMSKSKGSQSRKSMASSMRSESMAAARLQKKEVFSTGLSKKTISFLSINMLGTHEKVRNDPKGYVTSFTDHMTMVQNSACNNRGVVECVSGDRVRVSFNAVTHNAAHKMRVCSSAWELMRCSSHMAAGVSTGEAQVGNVGCKGMMKFSSFGRVVSNSIALEALAGELKEKCVLEEPTASQVETLFDTKKLVKVQFYAKATLVRLLVCKREDGEGEWMYALEDADKAGFTAYNEAVSALLNNNIEDAIAKLRMSPCNDELRTALEKRIQLVQESGQPERPVQLPRFFP